MIVRHAGSVLTIPQNVQNLGDVIHILCHKRITVGEGTIVAPGVVMVDHDHDMKLPKENIHGVINATRIRIGKYCWIGANAVILKGVRLGRGCIVGAGAVVTKSFPAYSVIVGNPARLVRKRK